LKVGSKRSEAEYRIGDGGAGSKQVRGRPRRLMDQNISCRVHHAISHITNFRFINQLGLFVVIAANHSGAYIATAPHAALVKTAS
jgi:hypothetical protein